MKRIGLAFVAVVLLLFSSRSQALPPTCEYGWFSAYFSGAQPGNAPNHALLGFPEIVFALLRREDDSETITHEGYFETVSDTLPDLLSEHTGELLARLKEGDETQVSLREANRMYPPRGAPTIVSDKEYRFPLLNMTLIGDGNATLNRVFEHSRAVSEPNFAATYSNWYITFPAEPANEF